MRWYTTLSCSWAALVVVWLATLWRWPERSLPWRLGFALIVVLLPLALAPAWLSPPEPQLPFADERLAINASRAWRWQLLAQSLNDRSLAVEDVRMHPDGERHRVCFRVYTWFDIPYRQVYVDLEPAGVRATGGGALPLSASCWVQP